MAKKRPIKKVAADAPADLEALAEAMADLLIVKNSAAEELLACQAAYDSAVLDYDNACVAFAVAAGQQ